MRIFPSRSISTTNVVALAALLTLAGSATFACSRRHQTTPQNTPSFVSIPQKVQRSTTPPSSAMTFPVAQLVSYRRVASRPQGRILRIGLTTLGGPIVMVADESMTITDSAQNGRRIVIPAGTNVLFNLGAPATVQAHGTTFSGNISVQTGDLSYAGWQVPQVQSSGIARIATDGADPRGRRGYRGNFEIAPQSYSFEPSMHKSPLRVVNILTLDQYLKGVVPWEMDKTAPMEALKAQAICARSETLAKIADGRHALDGFDMCDYDHCQGYSGTENESARTNRAVDETSGEVIMQNGHIADAVYGTNSGGLTSSADDVWRGTPEAYLKSVPDFAPNSETAQLFRGGMNEAKWATYCTRNLPSYARPSASEIRALTVRRQSNAHAAALFQSNDLPEFYRWTRVLTAAQMAVVLKAAGAVVTEVRVLERSPSGHIKRLQVVGHDASGTALFATYEKDSQIRSMFSGRLGSTTALPSSTFVVIAQRDANKQIAAWVFKGAGWGHGAGMCQRGAQNHALQGWSAQRIIQWYFRGVTLARVNQ